MNNENMVKIYIEADGDTTQVSQSIWATQVSADTYRLENIPIFSELSYQDVVKCECQDSQLVATEFVADSGNRSQTWMLEGATAEQISDLSAQLTDCNILHQHGRRGGIDALFLNIASEIDLLNAERIWDESA